MPPQENKIALFEKRYNCLFQIKTVLAFSKAIEKTFDRTVIIALFDSFWGTNVAYLSEKEQFAIAMSQTEVVKKDIEQAPFLFKYNSILPLRDIISSFQSVIVSAVYNKGMDASRNNFVSLCKEFIEKEPKEFIVPSNLIGKEEVGNIKKLFKNKI